MQAMTGSHSSPLATSDHDFSLFKLTKPAQEKKPAMVAKNQKSTTPVTESTVEPTPVAQLVDTRESGDEMSRLQAEYKATRERMKELRAAKAALKPVKVAKTLDTVIARQAAQPKWLGRFITGRVAERVRAGQSYDEALAAVLAHLGSLAVRPSAAE
jgi:hypothetical protein